jgi:hypothetical protein
LSETICSIRTKFWWNSHCMVLFQSCVWQSHSPTKMATTVQLHCYWKQLWSRWAITGSWEPLVKWYWWLIGVECHLTQYFSYFWVISFIGGTIVPEENTNRIQVIDRLYCCWSSSYQEGEGGIPLTVLTLPHLCACPKQGSRCPLLYVMKNPSTMIIIFPEQRGRKIRFFRQGNHFLIS